MLLTTQVLSLLSRLWFTMADLVLPRSRDLQCERNTRSAELDQQLANVEKSIKTAYENCSKQGSSVEDFSSLINYEVISHLKTSILIKKVKLITKALVAICLVSYLVLSCSSTRKFSAFLGRQLLIKLEPHFDWTEFYETRCLIKNPYFEVKREQLTNRDCHTCEDIVAIKHLDHVSVKSAAQFLKDEVPVIVKLDQNYEGWAITNNSDPIQLLEKIYERDYGVCMFRTNDKSSDPGKLLGKVINEPDLAWFAHWENCEMANRKAVRRLYARPGFLPPMAETTGSNWIVMSANGYEARTWKEILPISSTRALLVLQVFGANHIKLVPKDPCLDKFCAELEDTLVEGEALLISSKLWTFTYIPKKTSFNLAIVVEIYFK